MGAAPKVYDVDGNPLVTPHIVTGMTAATVSAQAAIPVTLSGAAAFTSATSYVCTVSVNLSAWSASALVIYSSGSSFTINYNGPMGGKVGFICIGS